MMEKKTKLEGDILLTARRNSLREAASSQIQARGKFRGFDVFTWIDAPLEYMARLGRGCHSSGFELGSGRDAQGYDARHRLAQHD